MTKDEAITHYTRLCDEAAVISMELPTGVEGEVEAHRARLPGNRGTRRILQTSRRKRVWVGRVRWSATVRNTHRCVRPDNPSGLSATR